MNITSLFNHSSRADKSIQNIFCHCIITMTHDPYTKYSSKLKVFKE